MQLTSVHWDSGRLQEAEVLLYFVSSSLSHHKIMPAALKSELELLKEKNIFKAEAGQVHLHRFSCHGFPPFLMLAGLGEAAEMDVVTMKDAAATAMRSLSRHHFRNAAAVLPASADGKTMIEQIAAMAEGLILGSYHPPSFAKNAPDKHKVEQMMIVHHVDSEEELGELNRMLNRSQVIADATNEARDWVNLPGNMLTPQKFAETAEKIASEYGLECEVWTGQDLIKHQMHGLHHVGKGSENKPACIILRYHGNPESSEVLGLAGKGITFDTGGISIKQREGMEKMIDDMGGAAAVLAAMKIAAQLKPKINIVAVLPCAENMPSGSAYKPGDVVPTLSGKTIEIINTDAEGRIVLADGVALAQQKGATKLIDVATLTGAVGVALGNVATGAITNDEAFLQELLQAAEKSGEKIWQLPSFEEYKELLRSDAADVRNSCGRGAGAVTAGLFIGAFVEDIPWIHLDIGSTVYRSAARGVDPKGASGRMVRTLAEYICSCSE